MKKNRLIIASPDKCADILYASHFHAPDPFIFFSCGRRKGMIVSTLEYNRAVDSAKKGVKVYNRKAFSAETTEAIIIEISREFGVDTWEVPGEFPLIYAEKLRENNINTVCCHGEFFPRRGVKTQYEVKWINDALRITEQGMQKAVDILRDARVDAEKRLIIGGDVLTSEMLRSEIEIELLRYGATAYGTITACGPQGAQPHNLGNGPLFAEQSIIIDIFPRVQSTGYWGDMTRTFVKGKAPTVVRKAFNAVKAARDGAKKMVKAGVKASKSYEFALHSLEEAGFATGNERGRDYGFIHGLGHGVGLEIHEYPRLSPLNNERLKKSSVVTVEPGVYYPEWGGVRLEDMVLVQDYGCRTMTEFETKLEIA